MKYYNYRVFHNAHLSSLWKGQEHQLQMGGQVILSADLGKKRQNASSFHSLLAPSLIKPSPVNKAAGPALYGGID